MNHAIPFKNEDAIKKLKIGNTIHGNSNMGGSFTYNITSKDDDGLFLSYLGDDGPTTTQHQSWDDLKKNFFVSPTYRINYALSKHHFDIAEKTGYTQPEEISEAFGCRLEEVVRGLQAKATVYLALVGDVKRPIATFANKHDAMLVSSNVVEKEVDVNHLIQSHVYKNLLSFDIDKALNDAVSKTPSDINLSHVSAVVSKELISKYPNIIKGPSRSHYDSLKSSSLLDTPNTEGASLALGDLFKTHLDTDTLSLPFRAQSVLNDPSSYDNEYTPNYPGEEISLLVNGQPTTFTHVNVNNGLSILLNKDLGTINYDLCEELKPLIADAIKQNKRNLKAEVSDAPKNTPRI